MQGILAIEALALPVDSRDNALRSNGSGRSCPAAGQAIATHPRASCQRTRRDIGVVKPLDHAKKE